MRVSGRKVNNNSSWLAAAISRADSVDDWLADKRQQSLALLRDAPWPSRKIEAWKYTPVFNLADASFNYQPQSTVAASVDSIDSIERIEGLDSLDLLFSNGQLQISDAELAALLPAGLTIQRMQAADKNMQSWAGVLFNTVKPQRHLFGLVNDVLGDAGLIIDVAAGVEIRQPIRIVHQIDAGAEAHTRVLVRVAEGATVSVIEQFSGDHSSFNTSVIEADIAANAHLEHYRFALQTGESMSVGSCSFKLHGKASLNSTVVGFGSTLSRLDVDVIHAGEFTQAKLNAIYLLDGDELFDLHSAIEHTVPNGTTEENVHGIVAGKSKAVFNGRIHIHRNAQKILAELNNRNLLMSRDAEINTKPELEIYADDVRCAHGATIAEIDKAAMYYLQSRGIDKAAAQLMLSFGFINELVDLMPNQALANWLRPLLRARFSHMDVK